MSRLDEAAAKYRGLVVVVKASDKAVEIAETALHEACRAREETRRARALAWQEVEKLVDEGES